MSNTINRWKFIREVVFGMNQSDFAKIAGCDQSNIHRLECGKNSPRYNILINIRTAALDRGLSWDDSLFFRDHPEDEPDNETVSGEPAAA